MSVQNAFIHSWFVIKCGMHTLRTCTCDYKVMATTPDPQSAHTEMHECDVLSEKCYLDYWQSGHTFTLVAWCDSDMQVTGMLTRHAFLSKELSQHSSGWDLVCGISWARTCVILCWGENIGSLLIFLDKALGLKISTL